jgi:hypothetical protein
MMALQGKISHVRFADWFFGELTVLLALEELKEQH